MQQNQKAHKLIKFVKVANEDHMNGVIGRGIVPPLDFYTLY